MKRLLTKILVFICCSALLFISIFVVYNRPIKTQASASLAGLAVSAGVVTILSALGVSLSVNGVDSGEDLNGALRSMVDGFEYQGKDFDDWVATQEASKVVNVLFGDESAQKTVITSVAFSNWVNALSTWLQTEKGLNGSSSSELGNVGSNIYIGSTSYPVYSGGDGISVPLASDVPSILNLASNPSRFDISSSRYISSSYYAFSGYTTQFTLKLCDSSTNEVIEIKTFRGNYAVDIHYQYNKYDGLVFTYSNGSLGLSHCYRNNNGPDYLDSCHVNPTPLFSDLNIPFESSNISIEGVLTPDSTDYEQQYQDAVGGLTEGTNEDEAVTAVNVGALDNPVTYDQAIEAIIAAAIDTTLEGTLTGVHENTEEAENENNATVAPTEGSVANNMIIVDGLEDFFPFCIPFDIYEIVRVFAAEPVAPRLQISVPFGSVAEPVPLDLDLSPFEPAARIFRVLIVITFLLFLIFKTRDLIRG